MMKNDALEVINQYTAANEWLDFAVAYLNESYLKLIAGADLTYGHKMEVIFYNTSFLALKTNWTVSGDSIFIRKLDGSDLYDFNVKNKVIQGNHVFSLSAESKEIFYVAARRIAVDFVN